ncbi:MAG TPA: FliH/SctL family protein [Cellvibrionaceae bacterium]
MSDKKNPNRIPAAQAGRWQSWSLPSVDGRDHAVASNEKLARDTGARAGESIEDVNLKDIKSFGKMTAEQLQEIVHSAEQEGFDKGYRDGLNQGRDEGYKAGQQQGLSEMRSQLMADQKRCQALAHALTFPVEQQDQQLQALLLTVVERLARAVVRRDLTVAPADIGALVRRAIAALPKGASHVRIYLHPDDLARVESPLREQAALEFIADRELNPGGVRVETPDSLVDDSVEHRLNEVIERFMLQQDSDEVTTDEQLFAREIQEQSAPLAEPYSGSEKTTDSDAVDGEDPQRSNPEWPNHEP